jgi:hypothetical protein
MLACAIEPGAGNRVAVGCQNSTLNVYDVATSRRVSQVCRASCSSTECLLHLHHLTGRSLSRHLQQVAIEGVPVILRAPTARGLVAAGLEDGGFAVLDPRAAYRVGPDDAVADAVSHQQAYSCAHGD